MLKKNLSVIILVLVTLLMIAMVIWVFQRRIERIQKRIDPGVIIRANE